MEKVTEAVVRNSLHLLFVISSQQVLMYCTGGIRCERATALLKYKMEKDPAVQSLGIKGVYQLQGGIDKYFKEFPDGGYWKGKNYVFDKRFAHHPPAKESGAAPPEQVAPLSVCESCQAPWDRFRGKRRCPTCGVPSLICKACWQAHQEGKAKLGRDVRCDLCKAQNITSKRELRQQEEAQLRAYETRMQAKGILEPAVEATPQSADETISMSFAGKTPTATKPAAVVDNPDHVTRVCIRNLCRKKTTEESLLQSFPDITHIVWRTDHRTQQFLGTAWVEMATSEAASHAVARNGERIHSRSVQISLQPPNGKDIWPPPKSAVYR
jgi:hypothetical protein